jgi:uncharacterized protein
MKLHEQKTGSSNAIRAYEKGMIRINDTVCTTSLIVTPDEFIPDWPVSHASQLELTVIEQLLEYGPDIILMGTGSQHHILDPRMMMTIMNQGTGIEVMTTDAACRTYNVLLGEDRVVLAALILESSA